MYGPVSTMGIWQVILLEADKGGPEKKKELNEGDNSQSEVEESPLLLQNLEEESQNRDEESHGMPRHNHSLHEIAMKDTHEHEIHVHEISKRAYFKIIWAIDKISRCDYYFGLFNSRWARFIIRLVFFFHLDTFICGYVF